MDLYQKVLKCTVQQPETSLLCGAYAVAMSLNALDCDLSGDIDISYNPGTTLKFARQSTIRGGDDFHGVAGAIYQVTGYLRDDAVEKELPATYCGLNGLAGMVKVLKDVAGLINIPVRYTAAAKAGFNMKFPDEFNRVKNLVGGSLTEEAVPMPASINNNQVVIALFDNGGGGNHWVVFSDTDSYDPATGDEVDETGPYNRGNALVAVLLEK